MLYPFEEKYRDCLFQTCQKCVECQVTVKAKFFTPCFLFVPRSPAIIETKKNSRNISKPETFYLCKFSS